MRTFKQDAGRARGFTIPELMITIAILSILLSVAVPSFKEAVERNGVRSKIKQFRVGLTEARSRATSQRVVVQVCGSSNGTSCDGAAWHKGWLAWADANKDSTLQADEIFIVKEGFKDNSTVTTSTATVSFDKTGATAATTEIKICPASNNPEYARGMVVQQSGVVRYSRDANNDGVHENNAGAAYTCP